MADPKIKYQDIEIKKLVPYCNNARIHSQEQIKEIQSSIREFGFLNPILVDENYTIIAGHGRYEAAKLEGLGAVPCIFIENLTDSQKKAYILADNRLAEKAGWDMDLVRIELESLNDEYFDIEITGFSEDILVPFEPIDLGTDCIDGKNNSEKTCICPKCGFEFGA